MVLLPEDLRVSDGEIYLRPITEEDTGMVLGWRNSEFVVSEFFYQIPISVETHLDWIRNKVKKGLVYQYIAVLEDGDVPFGCVYLQNYDANDNSIEAGIFLSPEAPKGIGVGRKTFIILLEKVAFERLKVDMIHTRVMGNNIPSIKMNERIGFKKTSTRMDEIIPTGEKVESIRFEISKEDLIVGK